MIEEEESSPKNGKENYAGGGIMDDASEATVATTVGPESFAKSGGELSPGGGLALAEGQQVEFGGRLRRINSREFQDLIDQNMALVDWEKEEGA